MRYARSTCRSAMAGRFWQSCSVGTERNSAWIVGRGAHEVLPLPKGGSGKGFSHAEGGGGTKSFHSLKGGLPKALPVLRGGAKSCRPAIFPFL